MTKTNVAATTEDQLLARRIATLMRVGTGGASALLLFGAVFSYLGAAQAATALLVSGCGLLVLLPVLRLVMMAGHFVRLSEKPFAIITLVVLALVIAGAVITIVR